MSNTFADFWEKRTREDSFAEDLRTNIHKLRDEILEEPLDDLLDNISEEIDGIPDRNEIPGLIRVYHSLNRKILEDIISVNRPLQNAMEQKTMDAMKKVVTRPVDFPEDAVREIVAQPAIKELFINIIHDAIIGFNKKFNPLFGAMAAVGMDKQIREFIVPFMDSVNNLAADFLTDKANQPMFTDLAGKIFEIVFEQKPEILSDIPFDEVHADIEEAAELLRHDPVFADAVREHKANVIRRIKEENKGKTIGQYLKDSNVEIWQISDAQLKIAVEYLQKSQVFVDVLSEEYRRFDEMRNA